MHPNRAFAEADRDALRTFAAVAANLAPHNPALAALIEKEER